MKLYFKECKKIAASVIYYLFLAILVFSWFQNFRGVTKTEINWEKGIPPADIGFERSLLSKPSEEDDYFGSKVSEDDPAAIMMGVTMVLGSFGFAAGHIQQFCYCRLLGVNRIFSFKFFGECVRG